jgi:hypothetical protein
MPIRTTIDHGKRLVTSYADSTFTLPEVLEYLDELVVAGIMAYAQLFDAGAEEIRMSDDDLMTLGARVNAYREFDPRGPLALVARHETTIGIMLRLMNIDRSRRPVQLFPRAKDALDWLEAGTKT